jgi:hypothetical protein
MLVIYIFLDLINTLKTEHINTLQTSDADLRLYITNVQDGWRKSAFLTRWNSVHLEVLLSATPQGGMFPAVSHPQALLGSLVSISWKFQFTKTVSEFVINSWFQTFAMFWMLCVIFWVFPRCLINESRRFGTLYLFHLHRLDMKCQVWVDWKRTHYLYRGRGLLEVVWPMERRGSR